MGPPSSEERIAEASRAHATVARGEVGKEGKSFKQALTNGFKPPDGAKFLRISLEPAKTTAKDQNGVGNVPLFLWNLIPQALEPIGSVIRMDSTDSPLPHIDARVLMSLSPGLDIPNEIRFVFDGHEFSCPIYFLGRINACFLCRREGHMRRACPILKKKPPPKEQAQDTPVFPSPFGSDKPDSSIKASNRQMTLNVEPPTASKELAATLDSLKEAFSKNELPPSLQGKDVMADLDKLPKTDSIDFGLDSP
ncbi:hypothetical protein SUGI_0928640 [Cryptomeria japonica]|nr:hypothetical protein SUGI_0928640 [Cryptomeria japonica]